MLLGQSLTVRCQVAGMSADGKRGRILHTLLHADGTTAATLTSSAAWIDINLRKLVAPPPEARSILETIRSAKCQFIS
jgi:acyl-CoA thioester hydrolase